jgi:hypothetical protein
MDNIPAKQIDKISYTQKTKSVVEQDLYLTGIKYSISTS